jgi:hypothetical protein
MRQRTERNGVGPTEDVYAEKPPLTQVGVQRDQNAKHLAGATSDSVKGDPCGRVAGGHGRCLPRTRTDSQERRQTDSAERQTVGLDARVGMRQTGRRSVDQP